MIKIVTMSPGWQSPYNRGAIDRNCSIDGGIKCGKGNAGDTITSGLEGAWSSNPIAFITQYLDNLFSFDWVQTKSPGGAIEWIPANGQAANLVPDAHDADAT